MSQTYWTAYASFRLPENGEITIFTDATLVRYAQTDDGGIVVGFMSDRPAICMTVLRDDDCVSHYDASVSIGIASGYRKDLIRRTREYTSGDSPGAEWTSVPKMPRPTPMRIRLNCHTFEDNADEVWQAQPERHFRHDAYTSVVPLSRYL